MKIPFTKVPNSTLNEKFNIATNEVIGPTDIPSMRYVAIGNGGHKMKQSGVNNLQVPEPLQHRTTDAALYSHIPFVMRNKTDPLSAADEARYALKRVETIGSTQYYAYYLRRMDLTGVTSNMELKTVLNGNTTTNVFIPTVGNLNPVPPNTVTGGAVTATGDYVTATANISFVLDSVDIINILDACNIMFGSEDYAIISEIGLCSGIDRQVSFEAGLFNEVIAAQIVSHISSFHALRFTASGVNTIFDVGATEPLFLNT
jgi:hypothetical protein